MTTIAQSRQVKKEFLDVFRRTGNVSQSCAASGAKRSTIYFWQESDPEFLMEYRVAEVEATEALEVEAHRRAVLGVQKTKGVYHNGMLIDVVEEREYSDTLLIFLLKARAPHKYRDNVSIEHSGPAGTPQRVEVVYTEIPISYLSATTALSAAEDQD